MENRKAAVLIGIVSVICLLGLYLSRFDVRLLFKPLTADVYYKITLSSPIELEETYTFHVKRKRFHVLFRNWGAPLTYREKLPRPFVEAKDVIGTTDTYIKDYRGRLFGNFSSERVKFTAQSYGRPNEVGIVNPDMFPPGKYTLNALYDLYPPIQIEKQFYHLNFKLSDWHVPYTRVVIEIDPKETEVKEVFPHMKEFSVKRVGRKVVIEGSSPENSLVEVELLTLPFRTSGFPQKFWNVKEITERENRTPMLIHKLSTFLKSFLEALLILFPLSLIYIYLKFGSEREFTVPEFLSFIPNPKRKPYEVNLLFSGDSAEGDENGFYATVLDLMRRGAISVRTAGDDVVVEVLKEPEDPYEREVVEFFKRHSVNGKFSLRAFQNRVKWTVEDRNREFLIDLKKEVEKLTRYKNERFVREHLNLKGTKLVQAFGFFSFILFVGLSISILFFFRFFPTFNGYPIFILSLTLFTAALVASAAPSQLFGRWKKGYYRELLQWEAFKKFLSDFALIKRYAPEDIVIWKEWLVYGTALGAADRVEEALRKFGKLRFEEAEVLPRFQVEFRSFNSSLSSGISQLSSSSSGSSGFGAGGGFGGGGAGGR